MLFGSLILLLMSASVWLWWKLAHVQQENVQLHAELSKLRGRARALRR